MAHNIFGDFFFGTRYLRDEERKKNRDIPENYFLDYQNKPADIKKRNDWL
jgi:homoserine trans-succinylase